MGLGGDPCALNVRSWTFEYTLERNLRTYVSHLSSPYQLCSLTSAPVRMIRGFLKRSFQGTMQARSFILYDAYLYDERVSRLFEGPAPTSEASAVASGAYAETPVTSKASCEAESTASGTDPRRSRPRYLAVRARRRGVRCVTRTRPTPSSS